MKKIYIYETNIQTMKKRIFRIIDIENNDNFRTLKDVVDYINHLEGKYDKYFYTWEERQ